MDLIRWVQSRKKPSAEIMRTMSPAQRQYFRQFELLHISADRMLTIEDKRTGAQKPCVPKTLQTYVIKSLHQLGHPGINNTYARVAHRFFFTDMIKKVELHVMTCNPCQKKKGPPKLQRHTLHPVNVGGPGQKWCIDIVGPLEEDDNGNKYILTARDAFTRYIEACPLSDMTSRTIATTLEDMIFSRHGFPEELHSDNAKNLTGTVIQEICRLLNIKKSETPAYNAKSNIVERAHRDLGAHLRSLMEETQQTWSECLPVALLAMQTSKCKSTGFSPFFMPYGREASLPIDVVYGSEPSRRLGPVQFANDLFNRLQKSFEIARENQKRMIIKNRQSYNQQAEIEAFEQGRLV